MPSHRDLANKQNVIAESHKYSSRSEFRWGTPSAYRSAIDNGWIDEMKWLKRPQNYNLKWTRENVFIESHKYDSRGAFKKDVHLHTEWQT